MRLVWVNFSGGVNPPHHNPGGVMKRIDLPDSGNRDGAPTLFHLDNVFYIRTSECVSDEHGKVVWEGPGEGDEEKTIDFLLQHGLWHHPAKGFCSYNSGTADSYETQSGEWTYRHEWVFQDGSRRHYRRATTDDQAPTTKIRRVEQDSSVTAKGDWALICPWEFGGAGMDRPTTALVIRSVVGPYWSKALGVEDMQRGDSRLSKSKWGAKLIIYNRRENTATAFDFRKEAVLGAIISDDCLRAGVVLVTSVRRRRHGRFDDRYANAIVILDLEV